ncbi:MAG: methyltransferase domain-containing protein [Chthoniobacterales bacterium]|nr:methyltransferase domain-containing protein [Chthoniobacterales bacterium]
MKYLHSYLLATDAKAAQNLDVQHDLLAAAAHEQLAKAGLKKGMVVWDVGCGSGAVTEYLARQVGETGHVYALDLSQEQLGRTEERLQQLGFKNVSFVCGDITTLENSPKNEADLVYARMVLMHLRDSEMALRKMGQLLKPSGMLSLQESTMSTAGTSTGHKAVNDYFQTLIALGNFNGVDFNIGKKLPTLCQKSGCFDVIEHYTTQQHLDPMTTKGLLLRRLEEWEGKAIEAKLVALELLQDWKKELVKLSGKSPAHFFHMAEQTHILARRITVK